MEHTKYMKPGSILCPKIDINFMQVTDKFKNYDTTLT